ncbi:unnamed protein product [Vicia faba]|uniref:Uncharacterized protein n=1 Tax=Vicia faba TaxID=3906 RepID=A0AAV1A622_VICFA|nr:unnamed protein product [Vicia faba]
MVSSIDISSRRTKSIATIEKKSAENVITSRKKPSICIHDSSECMHVNKEVVSNSTGKNTAHTDTISKEPHVESYVDSHVEPNVEAFVPTSTEPLAEPPTESAVNICF